MLRLPRNKISGMRLATFREQEETIEEGRVNGGMVTSIDAADIENNQFMDLKNVYVRYDRTSRRYGNVAFTPTSPDANKVLSITPYERFNGLVNVLRLTPPTVYIGTTVAWSAVAGTLAGGANDRFSVTLANDRAFFSNNGVDFIQEVNPTALTFARAGNAPRYKYLTSFNNRLVAANSVDATTPNPVQIGWSGDLNFTEWDAAVDLSAGSTPLIDSPTDYTDTIQGIFGFTDIALVLRSRSLWGMSKQPIATQPFNFFVIAPGIGCDSPYTAVSIRNGIAWFDYRSGNVYAYTIGMTEPTPIGVPVDKTILAQLNNVNTAYASYNTIDDEYTLCIPSDSTTLVKMWTYNFRTKAWWYEEATNLSTLANIDYQSNTVVIDALLGTIDSLVGTIDSLGATNPVASRIYGYTTGAMSIQSKTTDTDSGTAYTTSMVSKIYYTPRRDGYITTLRVEYMPLVAGSFIAYYSKDGGITWTAYKTVTWVNGDANKRKMATFRKHLKCSQYSWKIESTSGLFEIIEYEIFAVVGGESKQR